MFDKNKKEDKAIDKSYLGIITIKGIETELDYVFRCIDPYSLEQNKIEISKCVKNALIAMKDKKEQFDIEIRNAKLFVEKDGHLAFTGDGFYLIKENIYYIQWEIIVCGTYFSSFNFEKTLF